MKKILTLLKLYLFSSAVFAGIPSEYNAIQVKSPFSFNERVFDMTEAIDKAKSEEKNLFIYLGAEDCPPCKEYESFLRKYQVQLKDDFSRLVVVDIKTWLRGPKIYIKINNEKIFINDFKVRIGDKTKSLRFPSYWIVDSELKMIRQLPQGNTEFLDVERHRRLIQ